MKKFTLLVLACLIGIGGAFGLFAQGQKDAVSETGAKIVTLQISHNMDFITIPQAVIDAGERLNKKYAESGKNIQIEFETDYQTIDWTEYHNNMVFAHKSKDAPDIFALDSDIPGYVRAGTLLDLTDVMSELSSQFVPNVMKSGTVNGKIYAVPFDLPVRVIYYHKPALAKIGWTEAQIKELPKAIQQGEFSFEDFIALTEEVVAKGGSTYGLAHRPGIGNDFLDVLMTLGGQYYTDDGVLVFDEPALLRFFEFTYNNANVSMITPQNLNQMGWTTINTMVGNGECFAYYGPIYSSTYVASAAGLKAAEFAAVEEFVLFPVSDYNAKPFAIAAPQSIGVSAVTKYPEICKDLIRELATDSSDLLARHASKIYSLSSIKTANADEQVLTNPVIANATYMADYAITLPSIVGLNTFSSELFKQIVGLELGKTTPEKAVQEMKAQIKLNIKEVVYK